MQMMQMMTLLLILPALIGATNHSQGHSSPDFRDAKRTFEVFLAAVKADDLNAAKRCWFISDDNQSGVLDLLVGDWIATHRLSEIIKKRFTDQSRHTLLLEQLFQPEATTEAINRTLDR